LAALCGAPDEAERMYAVIKSGGKQYRVENGQQLQVELVAAEDDDNVELTPVLLVDGDTVLAGPKALSKAKVTAKVVGEAKGPKVTGFTYKNKSNNRRRWGHRQRYSTIEITGISKG
jgi:large subunit ribosomal protein L21